MGSYKVVLSLALTLVVLTPTSLASFNLWGLQDPLMLGITGQIRSRQLSRRGQQFPNECDIERLNANEPNIRVQAEAGVTEIWNSDDPEFRCAGVTVIRHVVEPGGLVQPFYANAPALTYVEQGEALAGVIVPGCPETFESGYNDERDYQIRGQGQHQQETQRGYDPQQEGSRGFDDRRGYSQKEGRRDYDDRRGDRQRDEGHRGFDDRRGDSQKERSRGYDDRRGDRQHDEGHRGFDDRRGDSQKEGSRGYDDRRGERQHDEGHRGYDKKDDRRHESGRSFEDRRSYQEQGSDRHQKVRRLREGHIFALPAGFSTWFHNHGERQLVLVTLYDTNNFQNQLDQNLRKFYLAGNPQESSQGGQSRRQDDQGRRHFLPFDKSHGQRQQSSPRNNVLSGFDNQLLSEILRVDQDTVSRIQGNKDDRGNIVYVQGNLRHLIPDSYEEERQYRQEKGQYQGRQQGNGLEETLCTAKLTYNIDEPIKADVFNPQGGRFTSLNSNKLPILNFLQLNANRVRLYPNAILAPHWKVNAHAIAYYTKGSGRVQVVDDQGNQVFDEQVQQGQLLVFPQNYAVLKRADQDGLEWVEFLTNDQAISSPLVGRTSIFRALPEEVIENSYGISREEARSLKYSRSEITVFSPSHHGSTQRKTTVPFSIV